MTTPTATLPRGSVRHDRSSLTWLVAPLLSTTRNRGASRRLESVARVRHVRVLRRGWVEQPVVGQAIWLDTLYAGRNTIGRCIGRNRGERKQERDCDSERACRRPTRSQVTQPFGHAARTDAQQFQRIRAAVLAGVVAVREVTRGRPRPDAAYYTNAGWRPCAACAGSTPCGSKSTGVTSLIQHHPPALHPGAATAREIGSARAVA